MNKTLLKNFLNEEIKKYLDEKAKSIPDIQNDNLCLLVLNNSGSNLRFVLYDGNALYEYLETRSHNSSNVIYGMLNVIKHPCGFYEVNLSAAKPGMKIGPLLYDIVMSYIHPNYLTSDRSSVSFSAQKVWDYMFYNRKQDFEIIPLTNKNCQYHSFGEEYISLNHKYRIKNKLDISLLVDNTKENFLLIQNDLNTSISFIQNKLETLSTAFFSSFEI